MEIHIDHEKIMTEKKREFNFRNIYQNAVSNLENSYFLSDELKEKLKEKRDFGLEKYGDFSFQSNFENCMTAPSFDYALEEIIDLLNYLLHAQYQNMVNGEEKQILKDKIREVNDLYLCIKGLKA